eukprot:Hpha_TRINITY_DN16906_c1_g3::TRINITY_DN16906_c1_g3_i1::g.55219::m.55219
MKRISIKIGGTERNHLARTPTPLRHAAPTPTSTRQGSVSPRVGCVKGFRLGQTVEVTGLTAANQYNGLRGTVLELNNSGEARIALRGPPAIAVANPWRGPLGGRGAPVCHSRQLPWERWEPARPARSGAAPHDAAEPGRDGSPRRLIEQQHHFQLSNLRAVSGSRSRTPPSRHAANSPPPPPPSAAARWARRP